MKQFKEIDPLTIQQNPRVVASLGDNIRPNITYYVLIIDTYALIAVFDYFTYADTGDNEWLTYQLEMPKPGIPWIIDTLEEKFFKLSHEGGLPKGVFHYEEEIGGEKLGLRRSMGLGHKDQRESGYTLTTHSRKENLGSLPKDMSFTDSFLFEHGFFDLLKDVAQRIRAGEL